MILAIFIAITLIPALIVYSSTSSRAQSGSATVAAVTEDGADDEAPGTGDLPNGEDSGAGDIAIGVPGDTGRVSDAAPPVPADEATPDAGDMTPPDTDPPVISGASDQTVFTGDSISYRNGVSAFDEVDGAVGFTVDSSAVNIYEIGEYEVTYSAVDSSGNTAVQTVVISVIDPDTDVVYEMADNILAGLLRPEMSLLEKAQWIHNWIRWNITFTGAAEKTNPINGAYTGFRTRQGDCFTFYSIAEVLLTRAGIPNMRVTRVGGYSSHYWNLINVGTGWYHFDATPTRERVNNFMFTSVQAEQFTRMISQVPNYYVYDKSLYPPVVGDDAEPEAGPAARFPAARGGYPGDADRRRMPGGIIRAGAR